MIFRPELAMQIMAGYKTVTRRPISDNPRSPWAKSLKVGQTYAVQPGRGKNAIGRVRVTDCRRERLGWLTHDEADREGFDSPTAFERTWTELNGADATDVWRIEFELVAS